MEDIETPLVVGVRFSKVGKIYHFESNGLSDIKVGDMVVVETSRGWQLGQVAQILQDPEKPPEGWKPIDRRATPRDLLLRQVWQQRESDVVTNCRTRAEALKLNGIKIVEAEYSFDGSRLTILFSSETEEKYDLKSLRGDMQKMFGPSQVEMRQIGPRDVAKTLCGMGACGKETRCCCSFLTEFSSISIRMAKEQGISLTPSEITGMCGRLRCCLIYEYDQYVDARKTLPKRNKRVRTPQGEGKVIDVSPLRGLVLVELPEVGRREFSAEEVFPADAEGGTPQDAARAEQPTQPLPVVKQPSEIDQMITGEEISPDRVEGVGDSGRPQGEHPGQRPGRGDRRPGGRDRGQRPGQGGDRGQRGPGRAGDAPRPGGEAPRGDTPQEPAAGAPNRGPRNQQNRPGQGRDRGPKRRPQRPFTPDQQGPSEQGGEGGSSEPGQGPDRPARGYPNRRRGKRDGGNNNENRA